ncbi:MAG: hypothetical protein MK108_15875 [Mariniblastus sp.]|nr:hypothetical protein [Mariniblastus sp.]
MKFSLKSFLLFVSLACLVIPLLRAPPLMSLLVFGFAFAAAFPVTDRSHWNAILLATLWGVGCYTILFILMPFFLILPFFDAVAVNFNPANSVGELARWRIQTGILIGGSAGWLTGMAYWKWRRKKDYSVSPIPRPLVVVPILMGIYGLVQVMAFTCQTTFVYRNIVFLSAYHQESAVEAAARRLMEQTYPFDVQHWFAVQWTEEYLAISYPSLILVGLLAAGGLAVWYGWQAKKPSDQDRAGDPFGADP